MSKDGIVLWAVSSDSVNLEEEVSNLCVGSSMDKRVGHKSGLVLRLKDHICSDTVCPVRSCLHAHHPINM